MNYVELNVPLNGGPDKDEQADILIAMLADFPFESFSTEKERLKAYIPKDQLVDCKDDVDAMLKGLNVVGANYIEIESQNWNALWESNFEPVEVAGCTIRAPFSPIAKSGLDIVIMPKMSFGTGHHATTCLIVGEIMKRSFEGKKGLDMGSGTGVLAIVAVKRGAEHVDAIDIDDWAYENCIENCTVNGVADRVRVDKGNVSLIAGRSYDFIFANINRNVLLSDMKYYCEALNRGGELIMSGILEDDIPMIEQCALALGLQVASDEHQSGWAAVCCRK